MYTRLSADDRAAVLTLARDVVAAAAAGQRLPEPAAEGALALRAGAFVSLHRGGDLRGCIGHIGDDLTLVQVICRCAAAAAVEDPRFPPVTPAEVPGLHIEISVLAGIERVTDVELIEVGRHGLIVEQQRHKGLLLPQVASEHHWDRPTFLAQTCRKAGLPPDAWQRGASISRFEAEVFGEPRG
jgi:hypothetical protein